MSSKVEKPIPASIVIAIALDAVFVLAFAAAGRVEHGGLVGIRDSAQAAWPFLLALAIMWLLSRAWRRPFAVVSIGIPLWLGTVAIGMVLRVLFTEGGAALPFILVATGVIGISLVGWRLVALLLQRLRNRRVATQ